LSAPISFIFSSPAPLSPCAPARLHRKTRDLPQSSKELPAVACLPATDSLQDSSTASRPQVWIEDRLHFQPAPQRLAQAHLELSPGPVGN